MTENKGHEDQCILRPVMDPECLKAVLERQGKRWELRLDGLAKIACSLGRRGRSIGEDNAMGHLPNREIGSAIAYINEAFGKTPREILSLGLSLEIDLVRADRRGEKIEMPRDSVDDSLIGRGTDGSRVPFDFATQPFDKILADRQGLQGKLDILCQCGFQCCAAAQQFWESLKQAERLIESSDCDLFIERIRQDQSSVEIHNDREHIRRNRCRRSRFLSQSRARSPPVSAGTPS